MIVQGELARALAWSDLAKIYALATVRKINRRSLERWSRWTYRAYAPDAEQASRIVTAGEHYRNGAFPETIKVLAPLPTQDRLSLLYVVPYYGLASVAFKAHRKYPISARAWDPSAPYASMFPGSDEGWSDIQDDEQFALLRLQGPNPFLLRAENDKFVVDYSAPFDGIWDSVRCYFEVENGRFTATAIDIGARRVLRGSPDWSRAKLTANALDARYAIFGQHLMTCHFLVAQAFTIAAHAVPAYHPLSPILHLFTNGVLEVNDFALRLLLSPESYFLQSEFIAPAELFRLMNNRAASFTPVELEPMRDIAARGLSRIPRHPYVSDAADIWTAMLRYSEDLVDYLYPSDGAVRDDAHLRLWHDRLQEMLPNSASLALDDKQSLAVRLASMIYNNVVHEVSGDYSPYTGACAVQQKVLVNFAGIREAVPPAPTLRDVFLFEQGAYAGTFNVAGNNLMQTSLDGRIKDQQCEALTQRLRDDLSLVERIIDKRNSSRAHPFRRMRPSQWEWSVSF